MKEEMESLEVSVMVEELKSLEGGYLKKIYAPEDDEILLKLYSPGEGTKMLLFKLGRGMYLTERDKDNPLKPGDYVMLMRKYLGNSKIKEIYQHEFDRVVVMELEKEEKYRLIFEIFGKGNLVLEGEEKILLPLRSESWKHRDLKQGFEYKFPPSRIQPFSLESDELEEVVLQSDKDLVRTLAVELNLGGKYAEEVCKRIGVDKNTKDLEPHVSDIYDKLEDIKEQVKDPDPLLIKENDEASDAVPFYLNIYEDKEKEDMESYNQALDLAFREDEDEEDEDSTASRLERKLQQQKGALENLKKEVGENKDKAEMIYQNYQECEAILDAIHKAREEDRRDEIYKRLRERDEVVQLNPSDEYIIVELENEEGEKYNVKLEFRKDVNENAQEHYEQSKKYKRKIEGAKKAIARTEEEIEEGEAEREEEEKRRKKKPTVKYWFDRYKWFISSEGRMVIAGRDAKTNEEVVKKYLEKYDRYAHADAGGAPSVTIKKEGEDIGEKTLKEACQYAVIHSKEWKRGIAAGRAYWVKPAQVSKTAEAGESLPTGAFVIRGNRNYMDDLPLKAVLAEIDYESERKIMCLPSYALEDREDDIIQRKVIFIPGNKKSNVFAKEMSDYFSVPTEEIQKLLPPGRVEVIEKD